MRLDVRVGVERLHDFGLLGGGRRVYTVRARVGTQEDRDVEPVLVVVLEPADLLLRQVGRTDEGKRDGRAEHQRDRHQQVATDTRRHAGHHEVRAHAYLTNLELPLARSETAGVEGKGQRPTP